MAEEHNVHLPVKTEGEEEVKDRGLFDFMSGKKEEEKCQADVGEEEEAVLVTGMENVHVEEKEEEKKESLLDKLHRSHSSSSSSSSDEEEEGAEGEKKEKKKKKGLKEKIKEKLHGGEEKEEGKASVEVVEQEVLVVASPAAACGPEKDTTVLVEKVEVETVNVAEEEEEKKQGFLDKIKEKLPGHKKQPEEGAAPPVVAAPAPECAPEEGKEKKGILGKIMEKLPGYHKSSPGDHQETADKATPPPAC